MDTELDLATARDPRNQPLPANSTTIGFSVNNRKIRAWRLGALDLRPTLIVAGQHGDEKCSIRTAVKLIHTFSKTKTCNQPAVWVIPCLNPDAMATNERLNAKNIDLNRDHLERISPEVRSLHAFIRNIQPRCVIDLHCFPSRRRWMKKLNLEHGADLLIDWATGPAELLVSDPFRVGLPSVNDWLRKETKEELIGGRYWLRSATGRIRHSTPDWLDLRNHVAARYRIPTYLLEGRDPQRHEPRQTERTIEAMSIVVKGILQHYDERYVCPKAIKRKTKSERTEMMPTHFRYRNTDPMQVLLRDRNSYQLYGGTIGRKYSDCIVPSCQVRVASVLWIPKSLLGTVSHLIRLDAPLENGADWSKASVAPSINVSRLRIVGQKNAKTAMRNHRRVETTQESTCLNDPAQYYVLNPPCEDQHYWTALLDPRHKFSACRLHPTELCAGSNGEYPILFQYYH